MTDTVKRRHYRSQQRAEQAAATRAAVLAAARETFIAKGWQGTTIAGVARAAKVSPETIYAVFGTKTALFAEVVRRTVRRDDPDTPLVAQPRPRAVADATDQTTVLRLFSTDIADILSRVAPVMAVAEAASRTEADIGKLYREIHAGRRENLRIVAEALARTGLLRDGIGIDAANAIVWRLASPEMFNLMTGVEGLSAAQFAAWLEQSLAALLLPDQALPARP